MSDFIAVPRELIERAVYGTDHEMDWQIVADLRDCLEQKPVEPFMRAHWKCNVCGYTGSEKEHFNPKLNRFSQAELCYHAHRIPDLYLATPDQSARIAELESQLSDCRRKTLEDFALIWLPNIKDHSQESSVSKAAHNYAIDRAIEHALRMAKEA